MPLRGSEPRYPDGYKTAPAVARLESAQETGAWMLVATGDMSSVGLPVVRIPRIRSGTHRLCNLKPRQWRHLTTKEGEELNQPVK